MLDVYLVRVHLCDMNTHCLCYKDNFDYQKYLKQLKKNVLIFTLCQYCFDKNTILQNYFYFVNTY